MASTRSEVAALREEVRRLHELLDRLQLLYVVKDPGNVISAEAFEGLRRRIAGAAKNRELHLTNLAQLHRVAVTSGSFDTTLHQIEESMRLLGLFRVEDPSALPRGVTEQDAFQLSGTGDLWSVISAAYCETPPDDDPAALGRVHIRGELERREPAGAGQVAEAPSSTGSQDSEVGLEDPSQGPVSGGQA